MNKKPELLKLNLQHFAQEPEVIPASEVETPIDLENPAGEPEQTKNTNEPKVETYTRSEVDSQISKAVESALEKNRQKLEAEFNERLEAEKQEAIEYQKLTDKQKMEKDMEKRLAEIEAREKEINNRELLSKINDDLRENNLPTSLAETLVGLGDSEKIKDSIAKIKKDFDEAVNNQVKESVRQRTPEQSTTDGTIDPFEEKLKKYR